mmetsp:Transcript_1689/g.2586  ORF Transcript_1689/g.2586 Transcript_1689/m.2586 type:complete len:88 (+) Transcript_1689:491-754(+)
MIAGRALTGGTPFTLLPRNISCTRWTALSWSSRCSPTPQEVVGPFDLADEAGRPVGELVATLVWARRFLHASVQRSDVLHDAGDHGG